MKDEGHEGEGIQIVPSCRIRSAKQSTMTAGRFIPLPFMSFTLHGVLLGFQKPMAGGLDSSRMPMPE
jgi:hypothetical protein